MIFLKSIYILPNLVSTISYPLSNILYADVTARVLGRSILSKQCNYIFIYLSINFCLSISSHIYIYISIFGKCLAKFKKSEYTSIGYAFPVGLPKISL